MAISDEEKSALEQVWDICQEAMEDEDFMDEPVAILDLLEDIQKLVGPLIGKNEEGTAGVAGDRS